MEAEPTNRIATQRPTLAGAIKVLEAVDDLGWSDVTLTCVPQTTAYGVAFTYHIDASDLTAQQAFARSRSLQSTRTGT